MKIQRLIHGRKESIIKNIIIWILIYIMIALPFEIEIATAFIVPLIIPVHLNYYLIDRYFKEKKYLSYGLSAGLLVVVFGFFAQGLSSNILLTNFGEVSPFITEITNIPKEVIEIDQRLILKFAFNPLIIMVLTGFYRNYQEKQQNIIQELETQRLKAELDFLKGQINPHFLFNVLNNLFSMSIAYGDENTANGIGQLSHLIRYMIYDTNAEYVSLGKEINLLENYINLQKLRMPAKAEKDIKLIIDGKINLKQIHPMLLITFVENAFKHGYSVKDKFEIYVHIQVLNDDLNVVIKNTINKLRENKNMDSSGIGLENVCKRLDLIYKDEYLLKINEKDNIFKVDLTIPLRS